MKVFTSHLAIRFYVSDGWSQEILDNLTLSGKCIMPFPSDERPYFIPDVGTILDIDRLMKKVTTVVRYKPGVDAHLTDKEYLSQFNW